MDTAAAIEQSRTTLYHTVEEILSKDINTFEHTIPISAGTADAVSAMARAENNGLSLSAYELIQNIIDHSSNGNIPFVIIKGMKSEHILDGTRINYKDLISKIGDIVNVDFININNEGEGIPPEGARMTHSLKPNSNSLGQHGIGLKIALQYLPYNVRIISSTTDTQGKLFRWVGQTEKGKTYPRGIDETRLKYNQIQDDLHGVTIVRVELPDAGYVERLLDLRDQLLFINNQYNSDETIVPMSAEAKKPKQAEVKEYGQTVRVELLDDTFSGPPDKLFVDGLLVTRPGYSNKLVLNWHIRNLDGPDNRKIRRDHTSTSVSSNINSTISKALAQTATEEDFIKILTFIEQNQEIPLEFVSSVNLTDIHTDVLTAFKSALIHYYGTDKIAYSTIKGEQIEGYKVINASDGFLSWLRALEIPSTYTIRGVEVNQHQNHIMVGIPSLRSQMRTIAGLVEQTISIKHTTTEFDQAIAMIGFSIKDEGNAIAMSLPAQISLREDAFTTMNTNVQSVEYSISTLAASFLYGVGTSFYGDNSFVFTNNSNDETIIYTFQRGSIFNNGTPLKALSVSIEKRKLAAGVEPNQSEFKYIADENITPEKIEKLRRAERIIQEETMHLKARKEILKGASSRSETQKAIETRKATETAIGFDPVRQGNIDALRALFTDIDKTAEARIGKMVSDSQFGTYVFSTGETVSTIQPGSGDVPIGGYYIGEIFDTLIVDENGARMTKLNRKFEKINGETDLNKFKAIRQGFQIGTQTKLTHDWQEILLKPGVQDILFFASDLYEVERDQTTNTIRARLKPYYNLEQVQNEEADALTVWQKIGLNTQMIMAPPTESDRKRLIVENIVGTKLVEQLHRIRNDQTISTQEKIRRGVRLVSFKYEEDRSIHEGIMESATTPEEFASRVIAVGKGICNYAGLIQLAVMRELDIPTRYVSGYVSTGENLDIVDNNSHDFPVYYDEKDQQWHLADMYSRMIVNPLALLQSNIYAPNDPAVEMNIPQLSLERPTIKEIYEAIIYGLKDLDLKQLVQDNWSYFRLQAILHAMFFLRNIGDSLTNTATTKLHTELERKKSKKKKVSTEES